MVRFGRLGTIWMIRCSYRSVRYTYKYDTHKQILLVDPIEFLFAIDNLYEKYAKRAVVVSGT